jgi:phytoene/squalene synthetase
MTKSVTSPPTRRSTRLPFALRRPGLLLRGARVDRDRPDLERLRHIDDGEAFVWAILPHAARTFATSILMLPAPQSLTAAVAYLYCRMLDTYEDLTQGRDTEAALAAFAGRFETLDPPARVALHPRTARDRAHAMLVERCHLVDEVFATLPELDRQRIIDLVGAMAEGMVWSARRFAAQGGVLLNEEQVSRYCHHVIGEPVVFALLLVTDGDLSDERRSDAFAVGELIQLANITRDVERDLERGIAYDPGLLPHLGRRDSIEPVREARRRLMAQALPHASAYTRLSEEVVTSRISLARGSAVLMLLHTDRHYASCAQRIGHEAWRVPGTAGLVIHTLLSVVSRRWSRRVMRRVEADFLAAAAVIGSEEP